MTQPIDAWAREIVENIRSTGKITRMDWKGAQMEGIGSYIQDYINAYAQPGSKWNDSFGYGKKFKSDKLPIWWRRDFASLETFKAYEAASKHLGVVEWFSNIQIRVAHHPEGIPIDHRTVTLPYYGDLLIRPPLDPYQMFWGSNKVYLESIQAETPWDVVAFLMEKLEEKMGQYCLLLDYIKKVQAEERKPTLFRERPADQYAIGFIDFDCEWNSKRMRHWVLKDETQYRDFFDMSGGGVSDEDKFEEYAYLYHKVNMEDYIKNVLPAFTDQYYAAMEWLEPKRIVSD